MPTPKPSETPTLEPFAMQIEGFNSGEVIPPEFSCLGDNASPRISWNEPPAGTQSFTFIFDDPDAPGGTWEHWILFNIPGDVRELAAGLSEENYPVGSKSGVNSWGELPYGGPCPPVGSTHEYVFVVYALDTELELDAGAKKSEIVAAMEGHVLAESQYTGLFSR